MELLLRQSCAKTFLGKTGTLRIRHEQWTGEVVFERGEVVAATLGDEQGMAALEAIALALPVGEFQFGEAEPGQRTIADRNLSLSPPALQSFLDGLQRQRPGAPAVAITPTTVPFTIRTFVGMRCPRDEQDAELPPGSR